MPNYENPELEAENRERIKIPRNIFELSGEELSGLKDRIIMNDGLARVLIHPFFEPYLSWGGFESRKGRTASEFLGRIRGAIKRVLNSDPAKSLPIIVFEEEERFGSGANPYAEYDLKNKPYIVPTISGESVPIPPEFSKDDKDENWSVLRAKLKELGIKRLFVGGVLLGAGVIPKPHSRYIATKYKEMRSYHDQRIKKGAKNMDYVFGGCAGTAVRKLAVDFDVEISALAFPHDRQFIKHLENPN